MSVETGHDPTLEVELPAGGVIVLDDVAEVDLFTHQRDRYIEDYGLVRQNDLMMLGALLTHAISMYRAQKLLTEPKKAGEAQNRLIKASEAIGTIEKSLGIDKKTREAGGQHTVASYITELKRAGHEKGIQIAKRTKEYERIFMELSWKIRLLRNGDQEDRKHHDVSEQKIIEWLERELATIEEGEKEWARAKGALFVGRL